MEYGIDYLRGKLAQKQSRVNLRYQYYEMKQAMRRVSALIPPEFRTLTYALGWCGKAVDTLSDRIVFDGFDNDIAQLNQIYRLNNPDVLPGSAALSALISSCSFLYIGRREDGFPTIEVIDGGNATGNIDTTTNLLTEGYAVLHRDDYGVPDLEAHFLPGRTDYYRSGKLDDDLTFTHKAPYPLLVPVIFRPDARRPFGHSRISRACMEIVQSALRTMLRTEVGAEFYSVPQKYIVGLEQDLIEKFKAERGKATLSTFLAFSRDEGGNLPSMGQFQAASMAPFLDQMMRDLEAKFPQVHCQVITVYNDFYGHSITVAGLLTFQDLSAQLKGRDLGSAVLLTETCLRHDDVFLDDKSREDLEDVLGVPVIKCKVDGYVLLDTVLGLAEGE